MRVSRFHALCFLLLFSSAGIAETSFDHTCESYLSELSELRKRQKPIRWETTHLTDRPLRSLGPEAAARARWIVEQMYLPESALGKQSDKPFERLIDGDLGWVTDYFLSYEVFYYSPLYRAIAEMASEALPQSGRILDFGSGTGGMATILQKHHPKRRVKIFDNPQAVEVAQQRNPASSSPLETHPLFLGPRTQLNEGPAQGVLINHVLYVVKPNVRQRAIELAFQNLESGGTLVINEPDGAKASAPGAYRKWLADVIASAVENGAPQTEFDVAFLAAMASGRVTQSLRAGQPLDHQYPTQQEILGYARQAGFELVETRPTYGGFSRFYVFRKP